MEKKKKKGSVAGTILSVLGGLLLGGAVLALGFGIHYFRLYEADMLELRAMRRVVDQDTYYDGIVIDGLDVGGKTYDEVLADLEKKHQQEIKNMVLNVSCQNQAYTLQANAFYNTTYVAQQAYMVGREGTLEDRYQVVEGLKENPQTFEVKHVVSTPEMEVFIDKIYQDAYKPSVNAKVTGFDVETKKFTFTEDKDGVELDREGLKKAMEEAVDNEEFGKDIQAAVRPVKAEITRETLSSSFKMMSTFTTKTTSASGRNTNIRLATETFNGREVLPGEKFSFNASTGERTPKKGYQDAGVIKDGVLIQEPGGGVCQVSTTLFNAVVRAGLKIVTRHSHSWPSSYVPTGFDAAVNWPGQDFVFQNTSEYPIYLIAYMTQIGKSSAYELTVEVYGKPILDDGVTIELRFEETKRVPYTKEYEVDRSMRPGEMTKVRDGHDNIQGVTYIRYMKDDKLIKEEVLFKNNYRLITQLYKVGPSPTKKPSTQTPSGTPKPNATTKPSD